MDLKPGDIIHFERPDFDEVAYQLGGLRGQCIGPADDRYPFQSEGTTVALKDGTIVHAYNLRLSEEKADGWHPHYARTVIVAVESTDEGRTWSRPKVWFTSDTGDNLSHPGFVRTKEGHLAIVYQHIDTIPPEQWTSQGYWVDKVKQAFKVFRRSEDEGKTWSEEIPVSPMGDYWTSAHDRLTLLSSGRLVLPLHNIYTKEKGNERIGTAVAWSDDSGKSWQRSRLLKVDDTVTSFEGMSFEQSTFHESTVAERADGSLLLFGRTTMGRIYQTESFDGGETWYDPRPTNIANSKAPVNLKRIPGTDDLLLVWNSHSVDPGNRQNGYRLTLSAAVSEDGGKTFRYRREIESAAPDPNATEHNMGKHRVCYPSVTFHNDKAYIGYWVAAPTKAAARGSLDQVYLAVLPTSWFYMERDCHRIEGVGARVL